MNRESSADTPLTIVTREPVGWVAVSLALLTSALWGGTPVAISFSVDELPPIAVAGIRFALAAVFMLVWCWWERSELRLRAGQFVPCLITGVLLFVQISLFHEGIARSSPAHATVLINTFVIWIVGLEHFLLKTYRLTMLSFIGLLAAAAGGFIIAASTGKAGAAATGMDQASLSGDLLLAGSGFLLAIKIIYTQRALDKVEPGKLIFWHDVIGVVLFAAWSLAFEEFPGFRMQMPTMLGILYQGIVVGGFCFAVQARLLQKHVASQVMIFSCSTPVFGILLAILLRGDRLSPWLFASGACVAVGILLVTLSKDSEDV